MVKKIIASSLTLVAVLVLPLSVSASGLQEVSGYEIVEANAGITETNVFGFLANRPRIEVNGLQGTWTSGNSGTNFFSTVVGNSGRTAARADGRGSVINGNGTHATGGWQDPGVSSRGSAFRTLWGTNSVHWYLRSPSN